MIDTGALVWVDARLDAAGRLRTGPVEAVRERPWGTVWRLPTDGGVVWLKQPGPTVRFELALLPALARLEPPLVPEVLGVDEDRGRVLQVDAGRTFRELYDAAALTGPFTAAVVEVGRLQRATAPLVPELLAAGVADLRPTTLPERFDELLDALGPFPPDIAATRPVLVDVCAELAASAVPAGVDHNDLHDGNVLRDGAGNTRVVDWGDSVVAHPFATLLVPARVLADAVGADVDRPWDDPAVAAARQAYLAGFAGVAPGEDLERTARLAVTAAHVARAWVWRRALTAAAGSERIGDVDAATFARGARDWFARAARLLRPTR